MPVFQSQTLKRVLVRSAVIGVFYSGLASASIETPTPPTTPKKPTEASYFGAKVTDEYSWLENAADPNVQKWTVDQNEATERFLKQIPFRQRIVRQLTDWNSKTSASYRAMQFAGDHYFAMKSQPPLDQPLLVELTTLNDLKSEHVILDLNKYDTSGATAIDWFAPSLDGRQVAVAMSKKGSEIADLHFFDSLTGKESADRIPRVNAPTAGGSVAWSGDGTGVYYTRYPAEGERPSADQFFFQQIYFHKLGTDAKTDVYSLGHDFPRIAEIEMSTSRDGKYVLAKVANGDGGEFAFYVLTPDRKWQTIAKNEDKIIGGELGLNDDVYLISRDQAPHGKVLRLDLTIPRLATAKITLPESDGVIVEIKPTPASLVVNELVGGPSRLQTIDLKTLQIRTLATEPISSTRDLVYGAGNTVAFQSESYVRPSAWYTFNADSELATPQITALIEKTVVDFSNIEVRREWVQSNDGTKVPINILMRQGLKKTGHAPTLLYGYGGYGISESPRYSASLYLWLEQGGIWVDANIRGGGEFGEAWHNEGMLTKKQNVFDDFAAAARYLMDQKYTDSEHLAIEGGSNGGLLMGAELTQHPDLFATVVSHVGIYDMLKVETDANGAFNVTEFGTVKDPNQFKSLYAYSPYHHIGKGVRYPAVLFTTGANDGRVNPYQSKKMTARLQDLKLGTPVLLRVNFGAGHGRGTKLSDRISERADVYAFLFHTLAMRPNF